MKGRVDNSKRALLPISIRCTTNSEAVNVEAWIDTAFDGHFVFSSKLIEECDLEPLVQTEAVLADGSRVVLETFVGYLDWFSETIPVQVVNNEGHFPLLGTALLDECYLTIDYRCKSVDLQKISPQ